MAKRTNGFIDEADPAGLNWRKSAVSSSHGGGCVEVVDVPGTVWVRDSKNPDGPSLSFASHAWQVFVASPVPMV